MNKDQKKREEERLSKEKPARKKEGVSQDKERKEQTQNKHFRDRP